MHAGCLAACVVASLLITGSITGCERAQPGEVLDVSAVIGEAGTAPGQFAYARAIAPWPSAGGDRLLVVDKRARIQVLDAESGECLAGWKTPAWDKGKPVGLHIGPHPVEDGRHALWVGDTHYHRVLVYELPSETDLASDSRFVTFEPREPLLTFGEFGDQLGQFVYVTDLAVLPSGDPDRPVQRVYVGEYGGNDRVTVYEAVYEDGAALPSFEPSFAFGEFGSGPGSQGSRDDLQFIRPQAIEFDPSFGGLVIADSGNHRVGRFTLEGELVSWIGSPETAAGGPGTFSFPYGVAVLEDAGALVVEFAGARVQHIDLETGDPLGVYGGPGREVGQLAMPWGIAVIGKRAFALDSGNNRVQAFASPGRAAGPVTGIGRTAAR